MEQFAILRLGTIRRNFDDIKFDKAVQELRNTRYNIKAKQTDAPWVTHCISAVRYIVAKSTEIILPKAYIGDMCHKICTSHQYLEPQMRPLSEQERWDLIFFREKSSYHRAYMISHIGIFIDDEWNFFHSNWKKWGEISNISEYIQTGKIATCKILANYTDPRRK
mgnify:FL=1